MKTYVTHITQYEVRVLTEKDWEGYTRNRPGKNWELIEYIGSKDEDGKPLRVWTPNYTLGYPKFNDRSQLKIIEQSKEEEK